MLNSLIYSLYTMIKIAILLLNNIVLMTCNIAVTIISFTWTINPIYIFFLELNIYFLQKGGLHS